MGGQELAEGPEEALAGGGVGESVRETIGDGSFVVFGADVADIGSGDEGQMLEAEGDVAGGAEFLGVYALQAGKGFGGARGINGGEGLAVAFVGAEGADAAGGEGGFREVVAEEVAPEAGGVGLKWVPLSWSWLSRLP